MSENQAEIKTPPPTMSHLSKRCVTEIFTKIKRKLGRKKCFKDANYTATQLAEELDLDKRIISVVIAMKTGENYNTMLNGYRLDEAKRMLCSADFEACSAEEIGMHVGFASRQAFYYAFSKKEGCTPRQYRLRCKKENKETSTARKTTAP